MQLRVSRSDRPWQSFPAGVAEPRQIPTAAAMWSGGVCSQSRRHLSSSLEFGFKLDGPGLPAPVPAPPGTARCPDRGRGRRHRFHGVVGSSELDVTVFPSWASPRPLQLSADQVASVTGGRLRTRAVALATALAVTATSTPALALADGGLISGSHAAVTQHRIQRLADFAAQRARAEAARKQQRSSSGQSSASRSRRAQRHRGALAAPVRAPGTSTRPARGQRHLTKTASGPTIGGSMPASELGTGR